MKPRKAGRRTDATGRSKGESAHVRLYGWELKSVAYRSLSVAARSLLIELKALYNGGNNGDLFLSVREAARRLGVGKNRAGKAFRELRDRGFIRPHHVGAFSLKYESRRGNATSWILTEFALASALPTKDFMRWTPPAQTQNHLTVPIEGQAVPIEGTRPTDACRSVITNGSLPPETTI